MSCNEFRSSCIGSKAQPRLGCPNCEFTIQYKHFREELETELKKIRGTTFEDHLRWPSDKLISTANQIAGISNEYGDNVNPYWTVTIRNLVAVYRNEKARMKQIDDFNFRQEIEGRRRQENELRNRR